MNGLGFKFFTVFVGSFLLYFSSVANADLIINGSFEQPPITGDYEYVPGGSTYILGWQTILTGVERFDPARYNAGASQDGRLCLDLNTDYGVGGGIKQTISTEIGQIYTLSFYLGTWLGYGRNGTGHIMVSSGETTLPYTIENLTGTIKWEKFSLTFTATSTATEIKFLNTDDPSTTFSLIDNVSVVQGCGGL